MKINAIQYTPKISNIHNKRHYNNPVQNDIFIRTEPISFGKKKTREELVRDFAKDIKKYYYDEPFNFQAIQKAAQKNIKGIEVKDYRELDIENEVLTTFMGALYSSFSYDNEKQLTVPSKLIMYLKDPNENTDMEPIAYYANAVHEYTHALQQADKDFSDVAVLNRLLRKSSASSDVKERTITYVGEFALDAEKRIKEPLHNAEKDDKKNFLYYMTQPTIKKIYEDEGVKDIKKFALDKIKNLIPTYKEKYGEMDEKILLEYTLYHLKKENEAYDADYETHIKMNSVYSNNRAFWNVKALIQLYKILSKIEI